MRIFVSAFASAALAAALLACCVCASHSRKCNGDPHCQDQMINVEVTCSTACVCHFVFYGDELRSEANSSALVRASAACVGGYDSINPLRYMANVSAWTKKDDPLTIAISKAFPTLIISPGDDFYRLEYDIDIMGQQEEWLQNGNFVASAHCDPDYSHVLLSGYANYPWLVEKEDRTYSVTFHPPANWTVLSSLNYSTATETYIADGLFDLLDSPTMMGANLVRQKLDYDDAVDPTYLHLWGVGMNQTFMDAVMTAMNSAAVTMYFSRARAHDRPYSAVMEMFEPSFVPTVLGWALEHDTAFQSVDTACSVECYTASRLAFHYAHHMYHSYFIPRRVYTDRLDPRECWQKVCVSDFVWFAEGFAQYNALAMLARAKGVSVRNALVLFAYRFGTVYSDDPNRNSLVNISQLITSGSSDPLLWPFSYSAGAILAMYLDQMMRGVDCSYGLHEATLDLHKWIEDNDRGIPEDSFESVFQTVTHFDITGLFRQYVRNATLLPAREIFQAVGISALPGNIFRVLNSSDCPTSVREFRRCAFGDVN